MSNVFYPISLIDKLAVQKLDRTISDPFESGATSTRRTWPAQYFKRRFRVDHAPMTYQEWCYLRSFYSQRSGLYDSFWFRDNVHREGNAQVRFATNLQPTFKGSARLVSVDLQEVAPIRAIPEWEEVIAAACSVPLFWYDPNRERYFQHVGVTYTDPAAYDAFLRYPATWQLGSSLNLGNITGQYQTYDFATNQWAKSAPITDLTGAQPACTLFLIAKNPVSTTNQILFTVGNSSNPLGFMLNAGNVYTPFLQDSTWPNARIANSPAATFRSFAVVWPAASNTATLYANAAAVGSNTNTRSFAAGSANLFASSDVSYVTAPGASLAHVMCFASALTPTQVKALHNLLAYQYGIAQVP